MTPLERIRIGFLVANEGIEQVELVEPWKAVETAGARPFLVAPEDGEVQMMNHLDKADRRQADLRTDEVRVSDIRNAGGHWVDDKVVVDRQGRTCS